MGGAVYGPHGCTCPKGQRKKELEEVIEVIAALDERIKKLEAAVTAIQCHADEPAKP